MPIPVTCPKCHTRFKVSEKFAGQKGPCPKCKEVILVPKLEDEVVISAPVVGPKDGKGRQILKPIKRNENKFSMIQLVAMVGSVVAFLIGALVVQFYVEDKSQLSMLLMVVPMAIVAPLVAYGAYNILKDQEIESFVGQELWLRVVICGAIYALLWAGMPLAKYAFGDRYDTGSWILALVGMLGVGGSTGMLSFDFDYTMGLIHYGLFLGLCLLARVLAGIGVFPGMLEQADKASGAATGMLEAEYMRSLMAMLADGWLANWQCILNLI
jgi:hypothetical protein